MNTSNSECSSGCESGWTMYLDQVSNSTNYHNRAFDNYNYQEKGGGAYVYDYQEEENLSMVSDASSGPPQFRDCCENHECDEQKKNSNQKKKKGKSQILYLDDTASSPMLHFSKDNVAYSDIHTSMEHGPGFSQGRLTPDFEVLSSDMQGDSKIKKHSDFFKSSAEGKKESGKSGSFIGKKRQ